MVDKKEIEKILTGTINEYYNLTKKCAILKSHPYYENAVALAEKYGLKLKQCNQNHLRFEETGHHNPLNDNITSTELRFDDMLKQNGNINFFDEASDHENRLYSLDEILGYFTSMPQNLKSGTNLMVFDRKTGSPYSTIYDVGLHKENVVHITLNAYKSENGVDWNLERIMAHEMGHCLEFSKLTSAEKSWLNKHITPEGKVVGVTTNDDAQIFFDNILPKMNTYSRIDGVFGTAVAIEGVDNIQSAYANKYYREQSQKFGIADTTALSEHFAETVSMASFKNKTDKTNAKLETGSPLVVFLGGGKIIDYDEFKSNGKQKESIPVVEKLLGI